MELNPAQTNYILSEIKKRGVHLPALRDDLLDHMCCLVENEMEQTEDFTKAYQNTLKKFESLRQIQAETTKTIAASGFQARIYSMLDYFITGMYAAFGLVSFIMPLFLTLSHWDLSFLLGFSPFVIFGPYILFTRIDYRRFTIIPFKEAIFPDRLVQ